MGTATSDPAAMAISTTTAVVRNRCFIGYLLLIRRLPQMAVNQLFRVFHTFKFQLRRVLFEAAINGEADLPWPRERFRIFDGRFVINNIRISQSKSLCDLQGIAMKVT